MVASKSNIPKKVRGVKEIITLRPPIDIIEVLKAKDRLVYWLPDGSVEVLLKVGKVIYRPPEQDNLVKLPSINAMNIHEDVDELYKDVRQFIYNHVDLPEDFIYDVLTLWIFHTWLIEKFNTSPIVHFTGALPFPGVGKTKGGDALGCLAKRAISTVNIRGASLFRVNEFYSPMTFIVDEAKLTGKDRDRDVLELLNTRFQRGKKVIRIDLNQRGLESIQSFDTFGATVLCGIDKLPETPRSRAIVIEMSYNQREIREEIDVERAEILRDRLCAFRAKYFNVNLPKVTRFTQDGRLNDVVKPLYETLKLVKPKMEDNFITFFKKVEEERYLKFLESYELEREVLRAFIRCKNNTGRIRIPISDITQEVNQDLQKFEQIGSRQVSKILSDFGFDGKRGTGGIRVKVWNEEKILKLCQLFDIDRDDISGITPKTSWS
jgi:hypothetical protein